MEAWLFPASPPVIPMPVGIDQVYVVPAGTKVEVGLFEGVIVNDAPLQMLAGWLGISGLGFTVTSTVKGVPGQPPEPGVIV